MADLFPEIEPYRTFHLDVSDIHRLYVEEVGNPQGVPVVFLHGGPGGGFSPAHRRLFDPAFYRIILFDQRGAGQSTPHACLEENTTWDLVSDLEKIRHHLSIDRWLVFGGSWGSTLGLAYAQTHPESVSGLILRGIFLCRPEEIRWFYQEGCSWIFPDLWEDFIRPVPIDQRHDMVNAYYKLLTSPDEAIRLEAAKAWSRWEGATCRLIPNMETISDFEASTKALAMARIECHYFVNHSFFETPDQLLRNIDCIRHIPTWIIHGRYDVVCPAKNAWDLHHVFPEAKLQLIPDAGHAYNEPGILKALVEATEAFKRYASGQTANALTNSSTHA
jgi:proline iminopeptidase